MRRILFVSEFASDADWHFQQLEPALRELDNPIECVPVRGFTQRRRYGGLSPKRLLNGAVVYAKLPVALILHRPRAILCITTPPGIQVWCTLLGRLLSVPVLCWLMDHHPELEARVLESKPCARVLVPFLRWLDQRSLRSCRCVIALDDAMAATCRARAPSTEVLAFPPWPARELQSLASAIVPPADAPLHLLHAGTLGRAHDIEDLSRLLAALDTPCHITLLGADARTTIAFERLVANTDIQLEVKPHLPGDQFVKALTTTGAHFGIVILRARSAGLVSPSKFTAYMAASIPLLYVGPPGTVAHRLCEEFGAGVSLPNVPEPQQLSRATEQLTSSDMQANTRAGTIAAREWLGRYDATAFAALIDAQLSPRDE